MTCLSKIGITLSLLIIFTNATAQQAVKGKIMNHRDGKPLSSASIMLQKKRQGKLSDLSGDFIFPVDQVHKSDTLLISSIGFKSIKISVEDALHTNKFYLDEESKDLENIEVKTYAYASSEGSTSEVTGYFRSWFTKKTGGEIGRILFVNSRDYKLERVRFKINNQCDTCIIRLHIRDLKNGLPDQDLLRDSISIVTNRLSFDDKFVEFDLRNYDVIIKNNKYVFVSFETLYCNSANNGHCSMCYIGTETGNYLYREKDYHEWEESLNYSIYIRMYYKF